MCYRRHNSKVVALVEVEVDQTINMYTTRRHYTVSGCIHVYQSPQKIYDVGTKKYTEIVNVEMLLMWSRPANYSNYSFLLFFINM
jgi:hypothetical protein